MRRTAIEENHLLAALPPDAYLWLADRLDTVHIGPRQLLALPDQHVGYVYFLRTTVVSLLVPMEDGSAVEGATLGNEGMLGLETFLGDGMARVEVVAQIGGTAGRMDATEFREVAHSCKPLQHLLQRYSLALMNQIARTSGCNRVHSVNERVTRVLLMVADRVGEDTFPLTHELLATMLGVRRASVSLAAAWLQHAGLIDYRRGNMDIVDRPGLESVACEDYRLSRTAYEQLNAEQWD